MNKALFLDRDGIINIDYGYTYKINQFKPVDSISDLIYKAKIKEYIVICITNQSGIEKGFFTLDDFNSFMDQINLYLFEECGFKLDDTYVCPHDDIVQLAKYGKKCNCRKPKTALITKAVEQYSIDVDQSIMIGDKITDVEAAFNSKIKTRIIINSRYNRNIKSSIFYTHRFSNLKESIDII